MVNPLENKNNHWQNILAGRLRFKHLQLIEALSRIKNILGSANEMGITQSAASKILADAERILKVPLFERQARGLIATAPGVKVIEFAKRALNELNNVAFDINEMKRGGAGSLRVGAIMTTTPGILPEILSEIREQRPLLTVHLTAATSDEIIIMLKERIIEVGLCRLSNHLDQIDFDFEDLFEDEYWIFVGANHQFANAKSIEIRDLVDLPWVMQAPPSPSRIVLEKAFAGEGVHIPASQIETSSRFATMNLVQHAGMISLLPPTILAQAVRNGELVKLPIAALKDTNYGLVTRKHETLSEPARLFAERVRKRSVR